MTDEQIVAAWAAQCKISQEAVEKLASDGFTSMEAIQLLDREDMKRSKLPMGQQKLILAAVRRLNSQTELVGEQNSAGQAYSNMSVEDETSKQTTSRQSNGGSNNDKQKESLPSQHQMIDVDTDGIQQSRAPGQHGTSSTPSSGDKQSSGLHNCDSEDVYIRALIGQIQKGQAQARLTLEPGSQNSSVLGGLGIGQYPNATNSSVACGMPVQPETQTMTHSWKDPQIYLASAAEGKSTSYHDITDFVVGNSEEEIIVGGNGTQQVILKSGPRKPKLEAVTLAQWSVANLGILYKLLGEGKLDSKSILDYLSYTTKICQLVQRFNLVSVLLYDREYRRLQSTHGFRWGTDIPHLQSVHLQARLPRTYPTASQNFKGPSSNQNKVTSLQAPLTLDGKIICKLFNTKAGCHFKECKYVHQCSQTGCHQPHSAVTHYQSKNA